MIATTKEDIENLRKSGKMLADILRETARLVEPGVSTAALDIAAEKMICARGGIPAFLHYKPEGAAYPYPAALCVSINEEIVHGIPSEMRLLQEGDIVCLDLGLSYNGYFTDHAVTVPVGKIDQASQKLIDGTREALSAVLKEMHAGAHTGDVGAAVMEVASAYGLGVVRDLGGHGVGKSVHEKPFIENIGMAGDGEELVEGQVLALEPMLALGKGDIILDPDGYTYRTRDGSRSAHFEHTVLITKKGAEVLTR